MAKQFRFFDDQTYHFQTLRVFNNIPYGGADTSEVLETIKGIKVGDADSWYSAWERTGDRVSELATHTRDPVSRGRTFLRAHTYYRTAEFLLDRHNSRVVLPLSNHDTLCACGRTRSGRASTLGLSPYLGLGSARLGFVITFDSIAA